MSTTVAAEQVVSIKVEDEGSTSDTSFDQIDSASSSSSSRRSSGEFGFLTRRGLSRINETTIEQETIKKTFLTGMRSFKADTEVVAVHKDLHNGLLGQARLESFRIFEKAVAEKHGGDANVKHAWYGGSKAEILEIISHGFSRCTRPENGVPSYGIGVNLSPVNLSVDGMLSSVVDENGLGHVLCCRVIMGNMEVVPPGSTQSEPSSSEFDSGVDDLVAPKRYVVWNAYMNSHILPCYVVSFRAPSVSNCRRRGASVPRPMTPAMRFSSLISMLSRFLPNSKMGIITKSYNDYKENKLSRFNFIQRLRQQVGDDLLKAVIKGFTNKQFGAGGTKSPALKDLYRARMRAAA